MGYIIQSDRCGTCQNNNLSLGIFDGLFFMPAAYVQYDVRVCYVVSISCRCLHLHPFTQTGGSRANLHN